MFTPSALINKTLSALNYSIKTCLTIFISVMMISIDFISLAEFLSILRKENDRMLKNCLIIPN